MAMAIYLFNKSSRSIKYLLKKTVNFNNVKCMSSVKSNVFQEAKIRVGDNDINYVKAGEGAHVVLCMPGALGSAWTDFKPQIEGLNNSKFTVIAWDPPGYGKSRPPSRTFPTNFYENDADVLNAFLQAIQVKKTSVLGWSDGGISGLILAAKYPDLIEKLVIWGANSFILPNELEQYDKIKDISTWSPRMKAPMVELYGEEYFADTWVKWIEGVKAIYHANNGDICSGLLSKIVCPVLIMHGEKDPMIDSSHLPFLHTNIKNSSIYLYPDGKHNIHLRYAEDFNKNVEKFLLPSLSNL